MSFNDSENEIDFIDKTRLASAFNEGGYVLDFSDATFDQFTVNSIGVAVKAKYNLSKAKSLAQFVHHGEAEKVLKLFNDLVRYFEGKYEAEILEKTDRAIRILALKPLLAKYGGVKIVNASIPKLTEINSGYIRTTVERACKRIENGEYDSALTNARTLLEEVFCYVLEKKGIVKQKKGDIFDLYNQVKIEYKMRQSNEYDNRINGLLSGLEKILKSISEMRNAQGDAHGIGSARIKIKDHHARLFVNSSQIMADFILAVANNES